MKIAIVKFLQFQMAFATNLLFTNNGFWTGGKQYIADQVNKSQMISTNARRFMSSGNGLYNGGKPGQKIARISVIQLNA